MKIRSQGAQAFNVPKTEEGDEFLRLMKKFLNRKSYRYRRRGRGPRPKRQREDGTWRTTFNGQLSLSPDDPLAEWIAVYLKDGKVRQRRTAYAEPMSAQELNEAFILQDIRMEWPRVGKPATPVAPVEPPQEDITELTAEEEDLLAQLLTEAHAQGLIYSEEYEPALQSLLDKFVVNKRELDGE